VTARATEIAEEQRYFDVAEEYWRRWLAERATLAESAADKAAARALKKLSKEQAATFDGSAAVAVGRMDADDGETLYIGRQLIRDASNNVLVVSWQADAALPYHLASMAQPHGLTRKRTFRCEGNTILDFEDVTFGTEPVEIDAALFAELARRRDGAMRDIVATIQAAQFDLIRAPFDQILVIEGGPGTGKTAIALHRVSWLLFHNKGVRPTDVLVIGPSPAFMRYISQVLPALGDGDVPLMDIGQLGPEVAKGRSEGSAVARLKGDARMAGLIARGLNARIGVPEAAERLQIGTRYVNLPGSDIKDVLEACRAEPGSYAERRRLFRQRLIDLVAYRLEADPGNSASVENLVERLWPRLSATAFLRDLLGSRARLATAAAGELGTDDIALLFRRGAERLTQEVWSAADLPLLDEAEALLNGSQTRYAHVVVDEVQDLSPMQLRSIARRSRTGSLTVVGDLAQATGPWAADSWDQVVTHLPDRTVTMTHLVYGYRVPEQVLEFASRLLPIAAPEASPPKAVVPGPSVPTVHRVGLAERAARVAAVTREHVAAGAFVGIICPERCRREVEGALMINDVPLGAQVTLTSPREAKGLEFEAVIVVEPEAIVAEDQRGHRMLYIAFTRATRTLDVVCVGAAMPLASPRESAFEDEVDDVAYEIPRLAEYVADRIRTTLPEKYWDPVIAMVRKRLGR
jgi:DNA helicase IV